MKRAWIFSVLWCLASAPILVLVPAPKLLQQPASLIALGFPMIGAALLVWAIRETLRWFEFGKTSFEMSTLPFAIGGEVRGTIQTRFPRPPAHGILLKLTCVNCIVTGSGNSQSTQEKIVWRDEKTVGAEELMPGPEGATIPVSFQGPLDARPLPHATQALPLGFPGSSFFGPPSCASCSPRAHPSSFPCCSDCLNSC